VRVARALFFCSMRTLAKPIELTITAALLLGCGDAPTTVQGGDPLFDASPAPVADSGAAVPSACQTGGANGGSTWADFYTCFFGPSGVANCSQGSTCHGPGGQGSGTWLCGATSSECWTGIQMVIGSTSPMATQLYSGLRKPDGSGLNNMPLQGVNGKGPYVFTNDDLQRIRTWIQGGAKGP
jgi:hypothetical protein